MGLMQVAKGVALALAAEAAVATARPQLRTIQRAHPHLLAALLRRPQQQPLQHRIGDSQNPMKASTFLMAGISLKAQIPRMVCSQSLFGDNVLSLNYLGTVNFLPANAAVRHLYHSPKYILGLHFFQV